MLRLKGEAFTGGRARFVDFSGKLREPTAKVFVKIRVSDWSDPVLAQLDTGAAWSVLEPEIASVIGVLDGSGDPERLVTRAGVRRGHLVDVPITFLADEGYSIDIEGRFFVDPEWPFGSFLGYTGLLDRIRFALDPPRNDFYFGESLGRLKLT
ncbi:MAG: hypothetical protein QOJ16_2604 [Acidobacteriota bacterium]|nr:hypothetical protein [Acidobacteriota bacterium]